MFNGTAAAYFLEDKTGGKQKVRAISLDCDVSFEGASFDEATKGLLVALGKHLVEFRGEDLPFHQSEDGWRKVWDYHLHHSNKYPVAVGVRNSDAHLKVYDLTETHQISERRL